MHLTRRQTRDFSTLSAIVFVAVGFATLMIFPF
jgi:hypothetical protein